MRRVFVLACCIVLFSSLSAVAQDYSGQWKTDLVVYYQTAHNGVTEGDYEGVVIVGQAVFTPPMLLTENGSLNLTYSDAGGYPSPLALSFSFTMTAPDTLPSISIAAPPPYTGVYINISGSVNTQQASGTFSSALGSPTGPPGPLYGTWTATKIERIPTATGWGLGTLIFMLAAAGVYVIRRRFPL